jgi:hypothetical protein
MKDKPGVMQEFARAFQFPDYFGRNWSALEDCLQDLNWLPTSSRYLTVITNRSLAFGGSGGHDLDLLINVLESVGRIWAMVGSADDHVAFNSVFLES